MQQFIPDQIAATSLLEKTLSRKCKLHKQYACEYLHTVPSNFSPRLCCLCIEERNIPASEFVFIKLLLQASTNTTFNAYPKLNDNSISKKIQLYKNTCDQIQEDLSSFFDKLKSTISLAIEKKRSDQKDKLASLQTSYQRIFDSLEQISQVEKLQELIENDNEEQLSTFIKDQFSSADTYTSQINNNLIEYQRNQEGFSLSDPNNKLEEIVKLIERIEFFPTNLHRQENNSQQQPSSFQSQPLQQQECLIQQQQQQKMQQEQQKKIQEQQQQEQEQQNQQQKQQQQQLKQQQQQQHQIEQSTSSQSVYSEYASLLKRGLNQKKLEKYGKEVEWWRYGWGEFGKYARTQYQWMSFEEEERQRQLSVLRKVVGPSN